MESTNISNDKKDTKTKDFLKKIKSNFVLKKINDYLQKIKSLIVFKYNKELQKRLNININDYYDYSKIEIELIPIKNEKGRFINIPEDKKGYYHIYFNESKDEIKTNELAEDNKVSRIKIIINYQIIVQMILFVNLLLF